MAFGVAQCGVGSFVDTTWFNFPTKPEEGSEAGQGSGESNDDGSTKAKKEISKFLSSNEQTDDSLNQGRGGRAAPTHPPGVSSGGFAAALHAQLQRTRLLTPMQEARLARESNLHEWHLLQRVRPELSDAAQLVSDALAELLPLPSIDFVAARPPDAASRRRRAAHTAALVRAALVRLVRHELGAVPTDATALLDVLESLLLFDVSDASFSRYQELLTAEEQRFDQLPADHVADDEELMARVARARDLAVRFGAGRSGSTRDGASAGSGTAGGGKGKKGKGKGNKQKGKQTGSAGRGGVNSKTSGVKSRVEDKSQ